MDENDVIEVTTDVVRLAWEAYRMDTAEVMGRFSRAEFDAWLANIVREAKAEALREAADDLDAVYFGPDQDTPFSTGSKYKWGATQSAKRLRERAARLIGSA